MPALVAVAVNVPAFRLATIALVTVPPWVAIDTSTSSGRVGVTKLMYRKILF